MVAADSGLEAALTAGLAVTHVVGDFDSVDPAVLAQAIDGGVELHRHEADKDVTDSELALDLVSRLADAGSVVHVFATAAGRLDHFLSDVLLLAGPTTVGLDVTGFVDDAVVTVVRPGCLREVVGRVGEQVSIVPVHGSAHGVTTDGLRWPLVDARLGAGTSRGVSNEMTADRATVFSADGVLAVVQPATMAPTVDNRPTPYDPSPR